MRRNESAWFEVAKRFERLEDMKIRGIADDRDDCRSLGIRPKFGGAVDLLNKQRAAKSKADAEAEARREKRFAAIALAVDGPHMVRVAKPSEGRRSECVHYSACLDAFVARHCQGREAHGECPQDCAYYERHTIRANGERTSSSLHSGGRLT